MNWVPVRRFTDYSKCATVMAAVDSVGGGAVHVCEVDALLETGGVQRGLGPPCKVQTLAPRGFGAPTVTLQTWFWGSWGAGWQSDKVGAPWLQPAVPQSTVEESFPE